MEKPRPPRPEPPAERDDVVVQANRCPFCRDAVGEGQGVVCDGCLTRQHDACWREGGDRCASCGGESRLVAERPRVRLALGRGARWALAVVGLVLALLVGARLFVVYEHERRAGVEGSSRARDGYDSVTVRAPDGRWGQIDELGLRYRVADIDFDAARGHLTVESLDGQVVYTGLVGRDACGFEWRGQRYVVKVGGGAGFVAEEGTFSTALYLSFYR